MNRSLKALFLIALFELAACNPAASHRTTHGEHAFFTQTGEGSRYSNRLVGRKTAAGGRFAQHRFTAAHRTLPFGTIVRVTNMENGLSVKVSINDRGPHRKNRIIDLSAAAARALGIRRDGVAHVRLQAFKTDQPRAPADAPSGRRATIPG